MIFPDFFREINDANSELRNFEHEGTYFCADVDQFVVYCEDELLSLGSNVEKLTGNCYLTDYAGYQHFHRTRRIRASFVYVEQVEQEECDHEISTTDVVPPYTLLVHPKYIMVKKSKKSIHEKIDLGDNDSLWNYLIKRRKEYEEVNFYTVFKEDETVAQSSSRSIRARSNESKEISNRRNSALIDRPTGDTSVCGSGSFEGYESNYGSERIFHQSERERGEKSGEFELSYGDHSRSVEEEEGVVEERLKTELQAVNDKIERLKERMSQLKVRRHALKSNFVKLKL